MTALWTNPSPSAWEEAFSKYTSTVEAQGVARLPELDRWFRDDLPAAIAGRSPPHVTADELVRVTEWKMARGVWRPRNLSLVRGNDAAAVVAASVEAIAQAPHPLRPITTLARLAGVGPATASGVMAAARPEVYPFFDELAAAQIPDLGPVAFTVAYYGRYAEALRERARLLGTPWTPARVEQALWAHAGGKAGAR